MSAAITGKGGVPDQSFGEKEIVVQLCGVYKTFDQTQVLGGVDLTLYRGENLVVLGKSGSGKSVLIKCVVGLEMPDAGEVFVLGEKISALTYKQLNAIRLKIGFLFQNGALYDSMTVGENLYFPLHLHFKELTEAQLQRQIEVALTSVSLQDSTHKMPSDLSGGMSKRIALARTLILGPDIMLYDEPTTGLDAVSAREISELIVTMQRMGKMSSIVITHDLTCAKITADRIVVLKEGIIAAEGTYEALAASDDEFVKSFFV